MQEIIQSNNVEVNSLSVTSHAFVTPEVEGSGVTSLDMTLRSNCNIEENQGLAAGEEKKVPKKRYCGRFTLAGRVKTMAIFIRHKCKTWGCGVCGPKKLATVKRGIYREADRLNLQRFMTLTLPGNYRGSFQDGVKALNKSWKKFGIYFKREFGEKLIYIKVIEPQKRGVPHLHVLVSRYIRQGWLSKAWQGIGGGRICDIRFVDVHRIAAYISKYMSKAMIGDDLGPYRRYSTSQEISINGAKQSSEGDWEFLRAPIDGFWRYAVKEAQEGRGVIIQAESSEGEIRSYEVEFAT